VPDEPITGGSNPWSQAPPPGRQFELADHIGSVVLVLVHKVKVGILTKFGPRTAVNCTVVVVDGPWKGEIYPDVNIFPAKLVGQLRDLEGEVTLGRFALGTGSGGKTPYILADPTAANEQAAHAWLTSHPGKLEQLQAEGKAAVEAEEALAAQQAAQPQQWQQPAAGWNGAPQPQQQWNLPPPQQPPWQAVGAQGSPPPPPVSAEPPF
jgi:hypothetical protein